MTGKTPRGELRDKDKMQVGTGQMAQDCTKIIERLNQFAQQTFLGIIRITEEDHTNLASDLVKLDQFLYLTDVKESLYFKIYKNDKPLFGLNERV